MILVSLVLNLGLLIVYTGLNTYKIYELGKQNKRLINDFSKIIISLDTILLDKQKEIER